MSLLPDPLRSGGAAASSAVLWPGMGTGGELSICTRDWHPGSPPLLAEAGQGCHSGLFLRLETSSKADAGWGSGWSPEGRRVRCSTATACGDDSQELYCCGPGPQDSETSKNLPAADREMVTMLVSAIPVLLLLELHLHPSSGMGHTPPTSKTPAARTFLTYTSAMHHPWMTFPGRQVKAGTWWVVVTSGRHMALWLQGLY